MVDVFSWILSPEIRKYLRGNCRPSLIERHALIRGAYHPIEEKMSAFQELCGEAEIYRSHVWGGNESFYCLVSCGYQVAKWRHKGECHPYMLPFSTGDLVYLDAPLFERPMYGIICCWANNILDGERCILLGYTEPNEIQIKELIKRNDEIFA